MSSGGVAVPRNRIRYAAGVAVACSLGLTGCANTWDAVTSRKFREAPFGTMKRVVSPEDPVHVLRTNPDGDDRAKAMHRLKEPLANGGTQEDQDQIVEVLAQAAVHDPSPVLRVAAVTALGRFDDPRAPGIIIAAYNNAHGRTEPAAPAEPNSVVPAGLGARPRVPTTAERMMLTGPTGFTTDTVVAIRGKALEALGRTRKPESARFLAQVAVATDPAKAPDGATEREIRLAAVRGLGISRQPEAVQALAAVMARESNPNGDGALVGTAHDGLVRLTGKKLPADPQKWNEVVQTGVTIAPEPNAIEQALGWFTP